MRFGAYEAVAEIGRGGMGVVYKGHAVAAPAQLVAIKVLTGVSPDALDRFDRERRLLASLSLEDGFVPLLDGGEEGGRPYLVMPFLAGGTLEQRLRRGPLGIEEAVALVRQLALAMQRAHERGIVHRDLKPANVLFEPAGQALVADLGLAKHFRRDLGGASQSRSLSTQGMASGTAGYMAPEQLDDSKSVTPAADVFALGVILFECLAGSRPFVAASLLGYAKALQTKAVSVRSLRADVPPWLARAVATALSPEPRERFADAGTFARALEKGEPASRRALVASVISVVVVAVIAGGAFALRSRPTPPPPAPLRPPPAAPPPKPPPVPSSSSDADELFRKALEKEAAGDLDGALLLLERLVVLDPKSAKAWIGLGSLLDKRGDLPGEVAALDRALELAPGDATVWSGRAIARSRLGDAAGALEDLTRAIDLRPGHGRHYYDRGVVLQNLRQKERALADYSRAIELDPTDARSLSNRAVLRADMGDSDGRLADLDRALALDPKLSSAWLNRGVARQARNDIAGAVSDFETWLELDPRAQQAPQIRAWVAKVRQAAEPEAPR